MSDVNLHKLSKQFGKTQVLSNIELHIEAGKFCCFVGPSGCGKSTLLRLIAGLEEPSSGEIRIGGRIVNDTPPAQRGVAMVFQSYALYPHMSVRQNMAFGLQQFGRPRREIKQKVEQVAQLLQIDPLLERLPKQLSGGQRQRVAIGRALVREPKVFLFDEPLSNLDASLRQQTRVEIAKLHQQVGSTMIYVTHDQVEAMTLADQIVVLRDGCIEQVGTPMELYHHPANRFVAGFIGSPTMNFLSGRLVSVTRERAEVRLAGGYVQSAAVDATELELGAELTLGVRPEHARLVALGESRLLGTVQLLERLGEHSLVIVQLKKEQEILTVKCPPHSEPLVGDTVGVQLEDVGCHLFAKAGEACKRIGEFQEPE